MTFIIFFSTLPIKHSYADTTYYAKITGGTTAIYTSVEEDSAIFIIPQSYFVEIISNFNSDYYYARYIDIYGYVKKSEVKVIKSVPITPFLTDITFRVFVPSGANLRSTPYNNGSLNLVYSIPFLETNLSYYGIANGEEAISKKGTIWYYCKYYVGNTSYNGYVYSPLCDSLTSINKNNENVEYFEGEVTFESDAQKTSAVSPIDSMPSTTQTIIIIAISLPCLLFIYLLFKPTMVAEASTREKGKSKGKKGKKKITKLRHSDYFEYDDDFDN